MSTSYLLSTNSDRQTYHIEFTNKISKKLMTHSLHSFGIAYVSHKMQNILFLFEKGNKRKF